MDWLASRELPPAAALRRGCDCHAPAMVDQSSRRFSEAEWSATDVRLPRLEANCSTPSVICAAAFHRGQRIESPATAVDMDGGHYVQVWTALDTG